MPHPSAKRLLARLTVACVIVGLIVVSVAAAISWWAPKAQFSCDSSPWGPSTARDAADGLAASIIERDGALACSVTTSSYDKGSASALVDSLADALGDPDDIGAITISLGEQMGSNIPASMHTAHGDVYLDIFAHAGQWRVGTVSDQRP